MRFLVNFCKSARVLTRSPTFRNPVVVRSYVSGLNGVRRFATIAEDDEYARIQELARRLTSNEKVYTAYKSLHEEISRKGYAGMVENGNISMTMILKVMSDSDIREKINKVQAEMKNANIEISQSEWMRVMQFLKDRSKK